jgi:DMSO/TMAO reductase YedYZ molybdopterin-dependent catalytic subunit
MKKYLTTGGKRSNVCIGNMKSERRPKHKPTSSARYPEAGPETMSLKEVAVAYGLKQQTLSRLSGFSLRAVAHWLAGKVPSEVARIRLTELERLLKALAEVVEPAAIESWLQQPNPAFQGSTPLQVIERGETDRLWRMLYELNSGEPG